MATSTRLGPWLVGTVINNVTRALTATTTITDIRNLGAVVASQEVWAYQPIIATGVNLPIYEVGVGGAVFNGSAVSIPNQGPAFQSPLVVPAGSRLNYLSVNIEQAPSAITGGLINFFINAVGSATTTLIATYPVAINSLTSNFASWQTTLAASQLQAIVGQTDVQITAQLAGTGTLTGGLLAEISVNYTVRNPSGSILRLP